MHDREERQRRNRTAEQALSHARGLLKRCDLLELWKLSARLSLHEAITEQGHALSAFPLLNAENVRMLCHTMLTSRATYSQGGGLPSEGDFRKVINDCNHALYDPEEMKPLRTASGTRQAHLEFQRFFVRLGGVQFAGQEPLVWERAGRLVAMLEELPRVYPNRVPEGQKEAVQTVLRRVEEILGARVSELARGFADVLTWQAMVHERSLRAVATHALPRRSSNPTADEQKRYQARITFAFLEPEPALDDYLVFNVDRILTWFEAALPGYSVLGKPRIEAFLRLAARSA